MNSPSTWRVLHKRVNKAYDAQQRTDSSLRVLSSTVSLNVSDVYVRALQLLYAPHVWLSFFLILGCRNKIADAKPDSSKPSRANRVGMCSMLWLCRCLPYANRVYICVSHMRWYILKRQTDIRVVASTNQRNNASCLFPNSEDVPLVWIRRRHKHTKLENWINSTWQITHKASSAYIPNL